MRGLWCRPIARRSRSILNWLKNCLASTELAEREQIINVLDFINRSARREIRSAKNFNATLDRFCVQRLTTLGWEPKADETGHGRKLARESNQRSRRS